jgi:hypothetical protein
VHDVETALLRLEALRSSGNRTPWRIAQIDPDLPDNDQEKGWFQ